MTDRFLSLKKCWNIGLFSLIFLTCSCGMEELAPGEFSLVGEFPVCQMDSVFIFRMDGLVRKKLVAAPVIKEEGKAHFSFAGRLPAQGIYQVGTLPNNLVNIILGGEKGVTLSGNCADLRKFHQIDNSDFNRDFQQVLKRFQTFQQTQNAQTRPLMIAMALK